MYLSKGYSVAKSRLVSASVKTTDYKGSACRIPVWPIVRPIVPQWAIKEMTFDVTGFKTRFRRCENETQVAETIREFWRKSFYEGCTKMEVPVPKDALEMYDRTIASYVWDDTYDSEIMLSEIRSTYEGEGVFEKDDLDSFLIQALPDGFYDPDSKEAKRAKGEMMKVLALPGMEKTLEQLGCGVECRYRVIARTEYDRKEGTAKDSWSIRFLEK